MVNAAVWLRVSTSDQDAKNQLAAIQQLCQHRGYDIVRTFETEDSAYNVKPNGAYKAALQGLLEGAHKGQYSVIVTWSLDRLSRAGAEDALRLLRQLRERGCTVVSVQESWLSGSAEVTDVLVPFASWVAQMESKRRSERVRAGLERRKAKGLPVGRQVGARDKGKRKTEGYVLEQQRRHQKA